MNYLLFKHNVIYPLYARVQRGHIGKTFVITFLICLLFLFSIDIYAVTTIGGWNYYTWNLGTDISMRLDRLYVLQFVSNALIVIALGIIGGQQR